MDTRAVKILRKPGSRKTDGLISKTLAEFMALGNILGIDKYKRKIKITIQSEMPGNRISEQTRKGGAGLQT
jgi:hypothetical protein